MWLGLILVTLVPASFACTYDGKTYKNEESGKIGWFTFQCIIGENKSWDIEITGCIWKRTGDNLKVGETKEIDGRTAKCYQSGDITRFEEKVNCKKGCPKKNTTKATSSSGSGTSEKTTKDKTPKQATGDGKPKVELKCVYGGKKYSNGENFRDGQFKFTCITTDKGWKTQVVSCFFKYGESPEVELKVGEDKKMKDMQAKCYKKADMTFFELKPLETKTAKPSTKPKISLSNDDKAGSKKKEEKVESGAKPIEPEVTVTLVEAVIKPSKEGDTKPADKGEKTKGPTDKEKQKAIDLATAAKKVGKAVTKAARDRQVKCKQDGKQYKANEKWTVGYFKYKCTTEKKNWQVDVVECYWPRFKIAVKIGKTIKKDKWMGICTPKNDDQVDFEEKPIGDN